MKISYKGFTLIEMLIVLVIIGILAGAMMIASAYVVSSVKAIRVLNNLQHLKKATFSWYTDNLGKIQTDGRVKFKVSYVKSDGTKYFKEEINPIQEFNKYALGIYHYLSLGNLLSLNASSLEDSSSGKNAWKIIPAGGYGIYDAGQNNRTTWFVGYRFEEGEEGVKERLKARAEADGLHFSKEYPNRDIGDDSIVWMKVFGPWIPTKKNNNS